MQPVIERLSYIQLAYFSRPSSLRRLYRHIRRARCRRILEIGLQCPRRALRMIETASLGRPAGDVVYTAIDLFELRSPSARPGASLRLAYRQLAASGARIQLLPGDPFSVLSRRANDLLNRDLILISGEVDSAELAKAWFYLPRMLHAESAVFRFAPPGEGSQPAFRRIPPAELDTLAGANQRRAA